MKLLVRLAWRNIWRRRRRTAITVSAMSVGIALCMMTLALEDGMYEQMIEVGTRLTIGHAQIHSPDYPEQRTIHNTIGEVPDVMRRLSKVPEVVAASTRVYGYALLAAGEKAVGGQLVGILPEDEARVTVLRERIVEGSYLGVAPRRDILLGAEMARSLGVSVGGELVAVTQAADGSLGNELYKVAGIFKTWSAVLDRAGAFMHQKDLQALLALEGRVHEIAILAGSRDAIERMVSMCRSALDDRGLLVRSWAGINPVLANVIDVQDKYAWVLLAIVFTVAALVILNTMLMAVFERTRELGMLRALGFRPGQVVGMILLETVLLSALSAVIGAVLGLGLDAYLVYHGLDLSSFTEGFSFSGVRIDPVIRGKVRLNGIAYTMACMAVQALAAGLWPAIQAAGLRPVAAMRHE